ncbi:uncharacterized protein LOC120354002 [Nilaparvata lugens]|uniref:uncharacterized protein LOC120354002 n=1 Tax=Nilaparvata lugens TaxID=108931 RepID=UPI00193E7A01|nr:uncharacterized protein LOC120354002 [Nilaparvata lugens]
MVVQAVRWPHSDFDEKIVGMENLTFCLCVFLEFIDVNSHKRNTKMLKLIRSEYIGCQKLDQFKFGAGKIAGVPTPQLHKSKMALAEQMTTNALNNITTIKRSVLYFYLGFISVVFINLMLYFINIQTLEDLRLPFILYIPYLSSLTSKVFKSLMKYIICLIFEVTYIVSTLYWTNTSYRFLLLAFNHVLTELKLFNIESDEEGEEWGEEEELGEEVVYEEDVLRQQMRLRLVHHQTIVRGLTFLAEYMQIKWFYLNGYTTMQLCIAIICLLKGEPIIRVKYFAILLIIIVITYFYSELGQHIVDECEKMRTNLLYCDWIGKPLWYKKSLALIMTQNNRLPEIRLFNIFTMNRNNLSVVVQASYSYFNLLKNFSN